MTITARREDTLESAADVLRQRGGEVAHVGANLADEASVGAVVRHHHSKFGRLDVLVNNAGVGFGASVAEQQTKHVDLQIDVNLRAVMQFYRECAEMLRGAAAEHRTALVVNLSSFAGKSGQPWLSLYSATKAGVVAYTQAMNKELGRTGSNPSPSVPASWTRT